MTSKKTLKTIVIIVASLLLLGLTVFLASQIYQTRQERLAPTEPRAVSPTCTLAFTILPPTPTPTPTPPPIVTPTPTLTPIPTPTPTPSPIVTPTPTPPTTLPEAGSILPTIGVALGGLFLGILGLLLVF